MSPDTYLFFYGLAELFGVVTLLLIAIIIWNAREYLSNNYLLILGISFAFIAFLHIFRMLFLGRMGAFPLSIETNVTAQLWLAARYLLAGSLVSAPFFVGKKIKISALLLVYTALTSLTLLSVFYWPLFPASFAGNSGETPFKGASEFIISGMFIAAAILLVKKRAIFEKNIFYLVCSFIIASAVSELFFALSASAYGFFNSVGYVVNIVAFYVLYRAVAIINFKDPYKLLLQSIQHKEDELKAALEASGRTVEELKASEQKFRAVAESMRNALITVNHTGHVVFWNKSAEHLFGYSEKEILGKSLRIIGLGTLDLSTQGRFAEINGIRKNGAEIPLETSSFSWKAGGGQFYSLIIRDITRRKEADRRLKEYAEELEKGKAMDDALLLSIADSILVADKSGKIMYANKALEDLCGVSIKEILYRDLDDTIPFFDEMGRRVPRENRPMYIGLDPARQKKLPIATSSTFYLVNKKDGRRIPLSIRAAPFVADGKIIGGVVVWRDITKEREVDKAKSEFISFASHQLRTPLTSISLAIDMLLNHLGGALEKEQKKYLRIAMNGIKDMTDLIETLLNISRIQMGTLVTNLEPIHLATFIDKIVRDISLSLKSKKIRIKKHYDKNLPRISLDQRIMKIVLENLLSNALKYNVPGGTILIEIEQQGKNALVAISDTGSGIPKDQQTKIFEKLFRVHTDIKVKGTGLGLYMVKAAVDQYGGRVWCESPSSRAFENLENTSNNQQGGTTFYVTVPLAGMSTRKEADK